ncbi:F-BAR and double SH3 domains protein 2-like [Corticium candelabrum]|uniref:F-BAR and double SH3 domains protein 2-like n=1 Tax=Corticium candelabrum TaxID=121492 RepID=UPI002E259677|nr:F-BAR and double SH3 domains protein 2-like [Corticium candelabrum]
MRAHLELHSFTSLQEHKDNITPHHSSLMTIQTTLQPMGVAHFLTMDADLFGKLREWFSLMADMEVKASCSSLESYQRLHSQAGMISREFELKSFLRANLQLLEFNRFAFEPHKDDTVNQLVQEYEADVILNKEARKCATKITKEIRTIREKTKALRGLQTVSTAYTTTPEFGSADAQVDVDQQIDDIQNAIRKAEIQKLKAEARLVVLRDAGVDVDQWKKSAGVSDSRENLLNVGDSNMSGSLLSLETTSEAPNGSVDFESSPEGSFGENQFTGLDDDDDDQSSNRHFDMPRKGIVLYDYEATKEDELSIHEGEEVSVPWYDGFGWCKGCNSLGIEGFFPESYVEVSEDSPPQDLTFQSRNDADTTLTDERVQDNIRVLRALYSYRASGNDELSFPEGAIIKLLRKDDNGVDDGFWEGEYEGRVGVFPSILVEQVDSVSSLDSGSAFSPPGDYVLPPMSDLVSGSPILQSPLSARESHESSSFD